MKDRASKLIEAELAKVPESTLKLFETFATDLMDDWLNREDLWSIAGIRV